MHRTTRNVALFIIGSLGLMTLFYACTADDPDRRGTAGGHSTYGHGGGFHRSSGWGWGWGRSSSTTSSGGRSTGSVSSTSRGGFGGTGHGSGGS